MATPTNLLTRHGFMWQRIAMVANRARRLAYAPARIRTVSLDAAAAPGKRADRELLTPEHRAWRLAVMTRAGWRCEWVECGTRCSAAHPVRLFADHVVERRDGGDPLDANNGQCLCGKHHARKTQAARAARMAAAT